ncbi:hypothetical protein [Gabonibacter chumensis]|uniref:hypothetical protein n=1 Tax=Gabonibacter chumensis TaxID=2972474 RepID=UPI0025723731|nr:hypothetical protein [Gabonibacter chumensis]MCR9011975.1 hypothetical protein [Gabonibacter chumensis]
MKENNKDIVSKLKYEEEIKKLNYNFDAFKEQEKIAYRWVHQNITDQRNFLPRPLLKKDYKVQQATDWGISMFNTEENAIRRLNECINNKPMLYKVLGSCIAEGNLHPIHGICDKPAINGHFNLMEYKKANLTSDFQIKKVIYNG